MNIKSITVFVVVTLGVLLGVGGLLYQFGSNADKPILEIAGEKKHSLGQGAVTLVEFSDFQCPACLAIQEPLKKILAKFEGKVEFVYRHFPLTTIHKNAQIAAQAAEAAGLQGKFFEMHDKLFITQASWAAMADPRETFTTYATELEMDKEKFLKDIDSQIVKDAVGVDVLAASRYALSGTPTFFVDGVKTEFGSLEGKILEIVK